MAVGYNMRRTVFITALLSALWGTIASAEIREPYCPGTSLPCKWAELKTPKGWEGRQIADPLLGTQHYLNPRPATPPIGNIVHDDVFIVSDIKLAQTQSLDDYYQAKVEKLSDNAEIKPAASIALASGAQALTFTYNPKGARGWEQVALIEDYDRKGERYFVIITLWARTEVLRAANLPVFETLVSTYKTRPPRP